MLHCVQYYKDAMLGRFYAICNCRSCCCGAMHAWSHGTPMLASSGYVAQVDVDLCAGIAVCAEFCQFGAISGDSGYAGIDAVSCMGCGVCVSWCTQDALSPLRPLRGDSQTRACQCVACGFDRPGRLPVAVDMSARGACTGLDCKDSKRSPSGDSGTGLSTGRRTAKGRICNFP